MSASRVERTVIEPVRGWTDLGVREAWRWRELLYFLAWRDLKIRYRQTAFGVAWAVLQPVLLMFALAFSIGQLAGIAPAGVSYPIFVLAALVPWILFAQAVNAASASLVASEAVITKVYFPRILLPVSAIASFLVDLLIATILLAGVAIASGGGLRPTMLALPAVAALPVLAALGLGTLLSAVNVRYRDVRHALPFVIQVWFFATPIVYSSSLIPEWLRPFYALNPMVGAVDGFRWAILGGDLPTATIVTSLATGTVLLILALVYFRRVEQTFADVI